jgi:phage terminase small subunit
MKLKPGELTEKQRKFITGYVKHRNGRKAALDAGCSEKSASNQANHWINHHHIISKEIKRLLAGGAPTLTLTVETDFSLESVAKDVLNKKISTSYTKEQAMAEAERLRDIAEGQGNLSVCSSMIQQKARLSGFMAEKNSNQASFSIHIEGLGDTFEDGSEEVEDTPFGLEDLT